MTTDVIEVRGTDGRIYWVLVDEARLAELTRWTWRVDVQHHNGVYERTTPYRAVVRKTNGRRIILARYLLNLPYNKPGLVVDHINDDTLDNRMANLRAVTPKQNHWVNKRSKGKAHKAVTG